MADQPQIDLAAPNLMDWLRLVFDHPVAPEGTKAWYWAPEWVVSDPSLLLTKVTALFRDFQGAVAGYSQQQVDQGVWFLLGPCVDVPTLLSDASIPWEVRHQCVEAMVDVFNGYVLSFPEEQELETCFFMWFDLVGHAVSDAPDSPDKKALAEIVLQALDRILALPDARCQHAALHGLGHLDHPSRPSVVERWLTGHRESLTPEDARWVEHCRDGTVR